MSWSMSRGVPSSSHLAKPSVGEGRRGRGTRATMFALGVGLVATLSGPSRCAAQEPPPSGHCAAYSALKRPLFGDLHVHTTYSFDANSLGVRNHPPDAYRFARGETLGLQPYAKDGSAKRHVKLERPLDFAAVTDHAELLGELHICQTPGTEGHDSLVCRIQRRWPLLAYYLVSSRMLNTSSPERYSFCGEGGVLCRSASSGPWQATRDAAEGAYDRTDACSFTSFLAYEWSGGPGGNMTHRNVIFADERGPDLPISYIDAPTGPELWDGLEKECAKNGCRFLTIPHNTNLSNGMLFDPETPSAEDARRRQEFEPLIEVMQHKGDSECRANAADELCSFEKLSFSRMEEQPFHFRWEKPVGLSFVRDILGDGLRREAALGENPFRLGMISSTDTHLAAAGLVQEQDYPGHGAGGDTSRVEVKPVPDSLVFNPGGLAVVWAEENSRESIWAALKRREVYSTSGPRMVVRFFGGFGYPDAMCQSENMVADGYKGGVSMGGELRAPVHTAATKPTFLLSALQDAGTEKHPGTPLDRLQIIKIWLDGGKVKEKIVDIATDSAPSDLDTATCAPPRNGSASLCAQWTDDEYDATQSTLYYARAVEKPSCRWSGFLCAEAHADCSRPETVPEDYDFCCGNDIPRSIQERAVTSPIWIPVSR